MKIIRIIKEKEKKDTSFVIFRAFEMDLTCTIIVPPALQEEMRSLFREAGRNEEIHFDGYVEDNDR